MQFGASLAGVGQSLTRSPAPLGDFFTGVLAVVVASPCTAPFMAGALGYAFAAPALVGDAGVPGARPGPGAAVPADRLRPGARRAPAASPAPWMETFKQWLAFPMYLTAVWLVWVFGQQRGVDALGLLLIAAVLLALALWWLERRAARLPLGPWSLRALAALALALALPRRPRRRVRRRRDARRAERSASRRCRTRRRRWRTARAEGRPVFVDMTADWCITCKVNEKAVFRHRRLPRACSANTVYMVGDWTDDVRDQRLPRGTRPRACRCTWSSRRRRRRPRAAAGADRRHVREALAEAAR